MITNILFIIFIVLMSVGVFYQIKDRKKNVEIKQLELKNAKKKNELLEMQIDDQEIRSKFLREEISRVEKDKE